MNGDIVRRLALCLGGLVGAAGVILSAVAAHGGDARLVGAASIACMTHAPALLALGFGHDRLRLASLATVLIAAGTILFAGDLVFRSRFGTGLFPMSAPTGGTVMIAGWVVIAIGALLPRPR